MTQPILSAADLYQHLAPAVLEDLYQQAPVGYHSLNAEGQVTLINDTELNWLGYSREEVIGQLYFSFLLPSQQPVARERFTNFLQTGTITDARFTLVRKDGSVFPVLLNATAIYDNEGTFVLSRSTIVDLTVQFNLENILLEKNEELNWLNEQLQAVNQAKNQFIGAVAHDLKNPITNLRMLAAKLRKLPASRSARQRGWIDEIDETAQRMGGLIQQTLDANRMEQTKNVPLFSHLDVQPLLGGVLKQLTYQAERKSIRLRLMSDQSEAYAFTDSNFLKSILENLLTNAIKFSPPGKMVWVLIKTQESSLQLSIIDEGPGIPLSEQPLLFKRFVSLSPKPTGGEPSEGLGLSIAKDYADQLGATLHYAYQPFAGSTFVLNLPTQPQPTLLD